MPNATTYHGADLFATKKACSLEAPRLADQRAMPRRSATYPKVMARAVAGVMLVNSLAQM